MEKIIWGVDPGSAICGVSQLINGSIGECFNETPENVYKRIIALSGASKFIVIIEDIYPYSLKLTPQVIDTCKLIGELRYRFGKKRQCLSVNFVPRNTVKKWVFDTFHDLCMAKIPNKIAKRHESNLRAGKKGLVSKNGVMRNPSFNWVDDKIIVSAMRQLYKIPLPSPGKQNIYGIKDHAWQALAVCGYYFHTTPNL